MTAAGGEVCPQRGTERDIEWNGGVGKPQGLCQGNVRVVGGHWLEHLGSSSSELLLDCAQPCSCTQYPGVSTNCMPRLDKAPGPTADQSLPGLREYQKGYRYLRSRWLVCTPPPSPRTLPQWHYVLRKGTYEPSGQK